MTCIIGSSKWVCADRRLNADGERYKPERKVFRNVGLIVGVCGLLSSMRSVARLLKEGQTDPESLIDALGEDSGALALTREGQLYVVGSGTASLAPYPIWAIGSGSDLAMGYLAASKSVDLKKCQRFVASRRLDCGDGSDTLYFKCG